MDFFYVKLPWSEALAARERQIHEALELALQAGSAGTLLGWGRSLGEDGQVGYQRIDIEVSAPARAGPALRQALVALGAPAGTELHYTVAGAALQEDYGLAGWSAPHPSSGTRRR